ncbi:MAG: hypothetical protein HQM06_08760 [Magnetococcales bacterium]|nr:hypothetical protein [Magnetococcales bacterium]
MKKLLAVCALGVMPWLAGTVMAAEAEADKNKLGGFTLSGNLTLTNNYVSRGMSNTSGGPALQGTVNVNHDTGFYLGLFGSNININKDNGGATLELDPSMGWSKEWENGLGVDLGMIQYFYPKMKSGFDYDYREYYLGGGYKLGNTALKAKYFYSDAYMGNQAGKDYASSYLDTQLTHELPDVLPFKTTLRGHYGYMFGDLVKRVANTTPGYRGVSGFSDYSLGVGAEFAAGLGAGIDWVGVDSDGRGLNSPTNANNRVVMNVSKSF